MCHSRLDGKGEMENSRSLWSLGEGMLSTLPSFLWRRILFCPWSSEATIPTPSIACYILAVAFPLRLWFGLLSTRRTTDLSLRRRGLD